MWPMVIRYASEALWTLRQMRPFSFKNHSKLTIVSVLLILSHCFAHILPH